LNGKKDLVDLVDCMKYDLQCVSERKFKPTDFYQNLPVKIQRSNASLTPPPGQMKNMFHSKDNLSKLCAEGAIRNLMQMLHHSTKDITTFWELATTSLPSLRSSLNERIPGSVITSENVIDSIEKCLWILRQKFDFRTTKRLKVSCFNSLKLALNALLTIKFPMVISVESKQATYNHVVVIWQKMVIDFESTHTYLLLEESLRQVCGVHTTFFKINRGYGLFPSKKIAN
jgi:hypothetical protein